MKLRHMICSRDTETGIHDEYEVSTIYDAIGYIYWCKSRGNANTIDYHTIQTASKWDRSRKMHGRTMYGAQLLLNQPSNEAPNTMMALCDDMVIRRIFAPMGWDRLESSKAVAMVEGAGLPAILGRIFPESIESVRQPNGVAVSLIVPRFVTTGPYQFRNLSNDPRLRPENAPAAFWCPQCDGLYDPRNIGQTNNFSICMRCFELAQIDGAEYRMISDQAEDILQAENTI